MKGPDAKFPEMWSHVLGGKIGLGGCGPLRPYGYGRTAYFDGCGPRSLTSVELDLTRAAWVKQTSWDRTLKLFVILYGEIKYS